MPLTAAEKNELVKGVAEDLQMFAQTKEDGKPSEEEVLSWRSGYIAGYQRAIATAQAVGSDGNTSLQE